ncbi:glycosyltransferase 87 family protein [Lentzea sp. BCCO 10_0856]|uniref:Glycosyltransferase 87 family protein n=1 Tax=Lentzea miocenica TaxID=3095431 RepID=A0ABU4T1S4_9PSEU|nr:glycosyltransferase 87 family protein [Lentzea sp. BCCO 10_0856]MDX8031913.1 glycosyltransferase 87 family protein [Lentzea sp. BCCO 10_0856]
MLLISRLADEVPPMSADAFESGRRRLLTRHRWVKARGVARVLWFVALAVLPIAFAALGVHHLDLQVYRTGGFAWLQGVPLYVDFPGALDGPRLPFTYPPIAAVIFSGLTFLPVWAANALVVLIGFLSLSAVCLLVTGRFTQRPSVVWTVAPAVAIAAVALEPVISTFLFGQINLVLMALVVVDVLAVRDPRWRGVLVGLAAAIKLTPLIFLLYFLVRKDHRAALTSAVTFVVLALAGFLFAAEDSAEYWFHALLDPSRAGGLAYMANQSLRGVLHRINPGEHAETLLWVGLSVLVVALAVVAARKAANDVVALVAIATAGLLVSPVSWSHHWVWCVPVFLALGFVRGNWARLTLAALLVVFLVQPFTYLPSTGDREMTWTWWQHVYGDAYTWVAIGLLVVLATRSRSRARISSA